MTSTCSGDQPSATFLEAVPPLRVGDVHERVPSARREKARARQAGIVVHSPGIRQVAVEVEEVPQAGREAAPHDVLGHVVAALADALRDPRHRQLRARQRQEGEMGAVARRPQRRGPSGMAAAREGRLEREVRPPVGELTKAGQHDAAGGDGGGLRPKGRQPLSDRVRVHELVDRERSSEQSRGDRALPRTVRAGEDDDEGAGLRSHGASMSRQSEMPAHASVKGDAVPERVNPEPRAAKRSARSSCRSRHVECEALRGRRCGPQGTGRARRPSRARRVSHAAHGGHDALRSTDEVSGRRHAGDRS
jgi:hypothetical protein